DSGKVQLQEVTIAGLVARAVQNCIDVGEHVLRTEGGLQVAPAVADERETKPRFDLFVWQMMISTSTSRIPPSEDFDLDRRVSGMRPTAGRAGPLRVAVGRRIPLLVPPNGVMNGPARR